MYDPMLKSTRVETPSLKLDDLLCYFIQVRTPLKTHAYILATWSIMHMNKTFYVLKESYLLYIGGLLE